MADNTSRSNHNDQLVTVGYMQGHSPHLLFLILASFSNREATGSK